MASRSRNMSESTTAPRHSILLKFILPFAMLLILSVAAAAWLAVKASTIKNELSTAAELIPQVQESLLNERADEAKSAVAELKSHTEAAREAAGDPLWTLASASPWLGENFAAVSEVARTADDVADLGVDPLVESYESLNWKKLLPGKSGIDLKPLQQVSPAVNGAAQAVRGSAERLAALRSDNLVPQIQEPLNQMRQQLASATSLLDTAADAAGLAPGMLGVEQPRHYLLLVQNNAEIRATGGIPGAIAVLTLENGSLSLGSQTSAVEIGPAAPPVPLDQQQQQIYTSRLGKYMQDVNLTPDFPTAASTARTLWENKTGQSVDGVVAIDPVVLSYILQSTGPVAISGPELAAVKAAGLPTELSGDNVVHTLLSDVYARIQQPKLQDGYFASVAREVFSNLSSGAADAKGLIAGISRGVEERRLLIWSASLPEQNLISKYALSGSISGPSVSPAQFGVYFNDGTGAKMDYYVKRTVQLVKECPANGYEQTTVRVTSTNTAPADAATSLPAYVTGGGVFGVAPGSVQTNIAAYGPAQSNVESATVGGQKTPFAPYLHGSRPVGVVAQQLAPGESKTVEFTFGKIVQHTKPNLVVTPTIQPVKDVILPTKNVSCDQAQ